MGRSGTSDELAIMVRESVISCTEDYKRREEAGVARRNSAARREVRRGGNAIFPVEGALVRAPGISALPTSTARRACAGWTSASPS